MSCYSFVDSPPLFTPLQYARLSSALHALPDCYFTKVVQCKCSLSSFASLNLFSDTLFLHVLHVPVSGLCVLCLLLYLASETSCCSLCIVLSLHLALSLTLTVSHPHSYSGFTPWNPVKPV